MHLSTFSILKNQTSFKYLRFSLVLRVLFCVPVYVNVNVELESWYLSTREIY